jgi:hypothetical protein
VSEIADFLRARYAERRAVIEAMPRGPWEWVKAESDTGDYETLCGPGGEVLSAADAESYKAWIEKHDALDGYLDLVQPEGMLADLDAKLALVDDLLAERHEVVVDCWYTCAAATEENDGGETCDDGRRGGDCDCGRDARVNRRLAILAQPFARHPDHKGEEWAR